ncbi:MAG: S1 RNA-binding domain-containing protein, partial [Candidatus Brocadiia bacterium]
MAKELCYVIEQISREKGIPREVLVETLRSALLSATRKRFEGRTNIDLTIDPKTCYIAVFETKNIVANVTNKDEEISLPDAKKISPEAFEGDTVNIPLDLHDFSRIAAQTVKQVIFQRVREAERDVIYSEFKDKVGQIVRGIVMRKEKGAYFINLGKTEAVLPIKDTLPNENLKRGDTVRAYIEEHRQQGTTLSQWLRQQVQIASSPGIEALLNDMRPGESKQMLIGFANATIGNIANILRQQSDHAWETAMVDAAADFATTPEEFMENLNYHVWKVTQHNPGITEATRQSLVPLFHRIRTEQQTFNVIYRMSIVGAVTDYTVEYNDRCILATVRKVPETDYLLNLTE